MLKHHANDPPKSHRHTNLTKLDPEIITTKIGGKQCTQNPISASNRAGQQFCRLGRQSPGQPKLLKIINLRRIGKNPPIGSKRYQKF